MKKVVFAMMLSVGLVGISNANPIGFAAPAIMGFAAAGLGYTAGTRDANGVPGSCYNEPVRLVKWKHAPGYSFEVAGCDYQAKKDKLIVLK